MSKIVFLTGGTSGYGYATAKRLTGLGYTVIAAARNEEKLKSAKAENAFADFVAMDVTKPDDWGKAKKYVLEKYGCPDILINNAGGGVAIKDTTDQKIEDIDRTISLNLSSAIYGSKIFGEEMKKNRRGLIINLSSVCAREAWPGWTVYASAKWGVLGFSKGLYVELQPFGLRVTCVIPAAATTGFNSGAGIPDEKHNLTADDVAQAIVNVCEMPEHVCVEEITVWGTDQVVNPL